MYALEANKLTKFYGRDRGIIDLSLKIDEGEIFGFIGPNGSGKTTTIRLFLNLLFPTSGSGRIFDYDIVRDGPSINEIVGFIPAEVNYYEHMTVKELIEYSARFYKASLDHRCDQLLDALDLDRSRKINELSTGNKKKVAVVQSLIHNPRLLILDEPTSGLDPLVQSHLFDILNERNEKGTTIFFSSHVLSDVEKFCRRVAFVKDGRIFNEDDISSLKERLLSRITYRLKEGRDNTTLQTPGVISVESDANGTSFLFKGEMPRLLRELSQIPIEKISITEPDLEEVFMHCYESDLQDTDI